MGLLSVLPVLQSPEAKTLLSARRLPAREIFSILKTLSTRAHCDVPWIHSPAGEKSHAPGTSRLSEAEKESSLERLQAGKQRNEAGI